MKYQERKCLCTLFNPYTSVCFLGILDSYLTVMLNHTPHFRTLNTTVFRQYRRVLWSPHPIP
ncbi:hypothetical protein K449DRAFT_117900 [Hypoxylon sp. EC38]|nr:hypothetical protein K449DRAFT_117900 [Hypoxylon sp. EC38]